MSGHEEALEAAAKAICPEWFGEKDGKHPLDNYPEQHKAYQQKARQQAQAAISAYTAKVGGEHGELVETFHSHARHWDAVPVKAKITKFDKFVWATDFRKAAGAIGALTAEKRAIHETSDQMYHKLLAAEAMVAELEKALRSISDAGPFDEQEGCPDGVQFEHWDAGYCEGLGVSGRMARTALSANSPGNEGEENG